MIGHVILLEKEVVFLVSITYHVDEPGRFGPEPSRSS